MADNLVPYFFIIPLLLVLYITIFVTNKIIKIELSTVKYPEIDGLRGYLAFFVFLHHSYIWFYFLKTGNWEDPKSNLFNHFGQTSVVFFFIITAFLFMAKLFEVKNSSFYWKKYMISRFYRMFPMYIFSVLAVFLIVGFYSNFTIKTTFIDLIKSISSWLFFSINGTSDINNFNNTFLINAGVTWTLPYEWMFYFLLIYLALPLKIKVSKKIIILFTLGFLIFAVINEASIRHFIPFIGGVLTAIYIKKTPLKINFKDKKYSYIGIILLILVVMLFESGRKPIPVFISTLVILFISNGNSFFGLFSNSLSRKFGQITYSLYLIHGIILFVVFYVLLGIENSKKLMPIEFWSIIAISIIPLIIISQITFLCIEKPFMNILKK
jgi:peptidoglycan/LPS O-acetylase OafA/YrhL